MHFYEKLIIMIVIFLGVVIGTAGIIGVYTKSSNNSKQPPVAGDRIILEGASI